MDNATKIPEFPRFSQLHLVRDLMLQGSTLRVNLWPQASRNSPKQLRASKKDLNWPYRASKHLETFLLKSFPLRMFPFVFEINEDTIYKDKYCG